MATARVFTDTWLRSLLKKRPAARTDYTELGRRGFMVRHHPGGTVAFVVRYQFDGEARAPITLGEFPALSLEQAHEDHTAIRKQLGAGLDPAIERELTTRERQRTQERERAVDAVTARNVLAEWAWHYARRERKRPREAVRLLHAYVADPWEGRPVRDLTKRDAVLLLDRIKARAPVMSNRIYSLASQVFTYAVSRDLVQSSPFVGVPRPGGDEAPRDRKLADEEIKAVWQGLDEPKFKATRAVRLAMKLVLVTAQRPGEVAGMRWDEIEGDLWTIPADRSKNGRMHRVPLSGLALELLAEARALAEDKPRPCVFPSVHAHQKADAPMLELALSRALRNNRSGKRVLGVDWFTPHDLRRSAASGMTALGTQRLFVSKVLNHSDRDVTGRVYDLNEYSAEKRAALTTWANHLRAVIAGKRSKVTPIRQGAAA